MNAKELLTLLYDGHGSTRGLMDEAMALAQRFAYDAYGVQLTGLQLTAAANAFTSLLYSGRVPWWGSLRAGGRGRRLGAGQEPADVARVAKPP